MIHYARLEHSERLKRLLNLLSDGRARTTLEIIQQAQVCAVSTAIAELRLNGYKIACRPVRKGVYEYQLLKGHKTPDTSEGEIASALPRNDRSEGAHNDTEDEDKSKAIIESIMERNFQLSLKV